MSVETHGGTREKRLNEMLECLEAPASEPPGSPIRMCAEEELIRRSAKGDMDAFAELARRKQPEVHRIAARICGPLEAEDVCQVVLLMLWKNTPLLAGGSTVDPWLRRVTVNRAIDAYRHIGRRLRLIESSRRQVEQPQLEEMLGRGEVSRIFNDVAEGLGERQRVAFVLRELEGLDTSKVARIMGIRPSTVRNLVHQARAELRKALRQRFPEYSPESERN